MLRALLFAVLLILATIHPAKAGFEEGYAAYTKKQWQIAIMHLRPLVEMGDARAMVVMGNMYLDGLGVSRDPKEAFSLYRRAAIRDNPDAMVVVGALYQQGIGVTKNMRYSAEWYGRAARLGHGSGAFFYGVHLFKGNRSSSPDNKIDEVTPDHEAAYKWFRIAAARTTNKKLAGRVTIHAETLAKKLSPDRLAALDAEVKEWVPEVPSMLGPLPEDMPVPAPTPAVTPDEKKPEEIKPEEVKPVEKQL